MEIRMKKMGTPIDYEHSIMHIMNNLPSAYDSLIKNLDDELDSTLEPLTMGVLRDILSEKYEKIMQRKGFKTNASDLEVDC